MYSMLYFKFQLNSREKTETTKTQTTQLQQLYVVCQRCDGIRIASEKSQLHF